jgi:hypothetical protein
MLRGLCDLRCARERYLIMHMRRYVALLAALTVTGCGETFLAPPQTTIVGAWERVRPAGEPPGFFTQINLALNNGSITGTGIWSGEAGPFGTITVTGTMVGESVQLDITELYDARLGGGVASHSTFSGQLRSDSDLVGRTTYDGQSPYDDSFKKAVPCPVCMLTTR